MKIFMKKQQRTCIHLSCNINRSCSPRAQRCLISYVIIASIKIKGPATSNTQRGAKGLACDEWKIAQRRERLRKE